jgi:hypothetical protein
MVIVPGRTASREPLLKLLNFQFAEVILSFEFLNLLLDAFLSDRLWLYRLCTGEVFLISLRFLWAGVVF